MKLEFAKFVEVTSFAKKYNDEYESYERIFICKDSKNNWICRILKGYNKEYEKDENCYLIEREKCPSYNNALDTIKYDVEESCFSNWDIFEKYDMNECVEFLDSGYGIILEGDEK